MNLLTGSNALKSWGKRETIYYPMCGSAEGIVKNKRLMVWDNPGCPGIAGFAEWKTLEP